MKIPKLSIGADWLAWVAFGYFLVIFGILPFFNPLSPNGLQKAPQSGALMTSRSIALAMFAFANDNNLNYPNGKSSTEVFQKLVDGQYLSDVAMLYLPMKGKSRALPGQKLKPENVCWDVTVGIDGNSVDQVPVVFLTGFKVTYVPGAAAVPLIKPFPPYLDERRDWLGRITSTPDFGSEGIAVSYKSGSTKWIQFETDANGNGSIPNFIPPDFKPDGHVYRQLTPDGVMP